MNNSHNIYTLGAYGNRLALQATVSCDGSSYGPGPSLMWFDPAADTTTVVLGPPLNGGTVVGAILYCYRYLP